MCHWSYQERTEWKSGFSGSCIILPVEDSQVRWRWQKRLGHIFLHASTSSYSYSREVWVLIEIMKKLTGVICNIETWILEQEEDRLRDRIQNNTIRSILKNKPTYFRGPTEKRHICKKDKDWYLNQVMKVHNMRVKGILRKIMVNSKVKIVLD